MISNICFLLYINIEYVYTSEASLWPFFSFTQALSQSWCNHFLFGIKLNNIAFNKIFSNTKYLSYFLTFSYNIKHFFCYIADFPFHCHCLFVILFICPSLGLSYASYFPYLLITSLLWRICPCFSWTWVSNVSSLDFWKSYSFYKNIFFSIAKLLYIRVCPSLTHIFSVFLFAWCHLK
mgnify:CR=1 FL=1